VLAHRLAFEGKPVAVVDQPVEDRICDGRILKVSVPLLEGQLAGDQRRLAVVAIIEDLHQIPTDRIGQWRETEVVDDDEIGLGELAKERRLGLQGGVTGKLVDEPREPEAADAVVGAAGGMADGASEVTLADAGGSGDKHVEVLGDPLETGDLAEASAIETAGGLEVDVLDGVVYHTYSSYARGLDGLWGMWQWLDRAPKGRNETGRWWRRHDEYDNK
jgi:hypothetical protein